MADRMARFTQGARSALTFAEAAAAVPDNEEIKPEHLLLGLLQVPESVAFKALAKFDLTYQRVSPLFCVEIGGLARPAPPVKALSEGVKRVLTQAFVIAHAHDQHDIGTEHLLLALLDPPDPAIRGVFGDLGVDLDAVRQEVEAHFKAD